MNIGYLVPEFPGQTHGFFWREIRHLESYDAALTLISTRRPKEVIEHGFSVEARARTTYLADFRLGEIVAWVKAMGAAWQLVAQVPSDMTSVSRVKLWLLGVFGIILARLAKRNRLDHIHGHSCGDVAFILAFSRLAGGPPYSLTLHGDLAVYGSGHEFKFAHAKFVACVTHALCAQVRASLPRCKTPVVMIRMGIEPSGAAGRISWSPVRSLKLLTVARLNSMKGHRFAIAAMRDLAEHGYEMHYTIAGEGEYATDIDKSARDAGLAPRVQLLGAVPNDKVDALIRAHDVCVLPSVGMGEAAPVAVMEAMRAGIPVVCSIIGGTPEMIVHGETGYLFPQEDVGSLASILRMLADDPALREKVGSAGRDYATRNFLTSDAARAMLERIAS